MGEPLYLRDVCDLIDSLKLADNIYMAKMDDKKTKCIGIYNLDKNMPYNPLIGGDEGRTHSIKTVSFLVHWTNKPSETETMASKLYEALRAIGNVEVNEKKIKFIMPLSDAPIDVGTNDSGIFEYVIQTAIYYER